MPELPEVETVVNELRPLLANKKIKEVRVLMPKMVAMGPATLSPLRKPGEKVSEEFSKTLKGKKFTGISRRAKMIIMDLAPPPPPQTRLGGGGGGAAAGFGRLE